MTARASLFALIAASTGAGGLFHLALNTDLPMALAGTGPDESGNPGRIRLKNPGVRTWQPEFSGERQFWRARPAAGYDRLALPTGFMIPVFSSVEKPRKVVGRVRRGVALSARRVATSIKCYDRGQRGRWYQIDGGFICSTSGFDLVSKTEALDPPQQDPRITTPHPFDYARVALSGAARLSRRPSLTEWEALASVGGPKDDPSGLMIERMIGDFFVTLGEEVSIGGIPFVRTVRNEYVEKKALKPKAQPNMIGERLKAGRSLPIAFVYGADETKLLCPDRKTICGVAEKHARFKPGKRTNVSGRPYVEGPEGVLVPAEAVRIIQKRGRPPGVLKGDKWVHIDLAHQTLVAYEGDKPVYATLVSSGKEGHTTPSGLYRIQRKYLSKTMRAVDPKEGLYHIEDIPWTMYYYGSYAVHGAFWHDVFGQVRSHGCTNVAPPDARWIYHWSDPKVPEPWHARENIARGTAFYFTNDPKQPS